MLKELLREYDGAKSLSTIRIKRTTVQVEDVTSLFVCIECRYVTTFNLSHFVISKPSRIRKHSLTMYNVESTESAQMRLKPTICWLYVQPTCAMLNLTCC